MSSWNNGSYFILYIFFQEKMSGSLYTKDDKSINRWWRTFFQPTRLKYLSRSLDSFRTKGVTDEDRQGYLSIWHYQYKEKGSNSWNYLEVEKWIFENDSVNLLINKSVWTV